MRFQRNITNEIFSSLNSKHYLIDIISGPRQVGKTIAANYIEKKWNGEVFYANADLAVNLGTDWLIFQWNQIRNAVANSGGRGLLIFDEMQKIDKWSEIVKGMWEEDRKSRTPIKVLLLGSSSLLLSRGLTESLAGRFILHRFNHWSYPECRKAFKFNLDKWIYFGGYPGAFRFIKNESLWKQYIMDSLIETVISRDVLALQNVSKPALLRNLFYLAASYPAQILSYNKMLRQMHDAGNTTTLAHYLKLLETAFLISGLENYSGSSVRNRSSSPKLILWNNALVNVIHTRSFKESRKDMSFWGRLLENAVGAHLVSNLQSINYRVMYWRERNFEVDFILTAGKKLFAIEVKSGSIKKPQGMSVFMKKHRNAVPVFVGPGGIDFEDFFSKSPQELLNI